MATPFTGVIILLMAALAFTACPTEGSGGSGNAVSIKDIQGVTVPQVGDSPVASITPNSQFSGTVRWEPNTPTFQPRTTYKAIITLNPISPNTMQGVPANYFTVQGAVTVRNNANSGLVEAVFGLTGGEENNPSAITNTAIRGINRPKTDEIATKFVDDVQYSGTVNWSPGVGETFNFGVEYTATVVLTAKRGWTFAIDQSNWSIAGKEATFNNIGQGFAEVKTTFPMTTNDATAISIQGIELSELPRTGGLASAIKVRDTNEYTATIEWRPGPQGTRIGTADDGEVWNGRFLPGNNPPGGSDHGPVAYISLIPKPNYTLEGIPKNYFYIVGVEAKPDEDSDGNQINPSNTADRGIISYTFKPLDMQVTIDTIESVDFKVPYYDVTNEKGEIASLVINNNGEYTGVIEWVPQPNTVSKRFEPGVKYEANITLTPRKGWTFYGRDENWFKMPGSISLKHEPYTGVLKAVFPTTGSKDNKTTIDGLAIELTGFRQGQLATGVAIRQTGHKFDSDPSGVSVIVQQFQKDAGVDITFEPTPVAGRFVAGTVYTASFAVVARTGFTLEGVKANTFTVNGKPAKHAADSGIITVDLGVVPKIDIAGENDDALAGTFVPNVDPTDRVITGVSKPAQNAAASKKITNTLYFKADGDIKWEPALPTVSTKIDSSAGLSVEYKDRFLPNQQYTAKIKIQDSDQYTLDELKDKDFFIVTNPANSGSSLVEVSTGSAINYGTAAAAFGTTDNTLVATTEEKPNPWYDKDTKTITVVFNKTAPLHLPSSIELSLAAPVTDNLTELEFDKEGFFTGTAVWYDKNNSIINGEKFKAGEVYHVDVDLSPVAGSYYEFTGTETFTVKGSGTVTSVKLTNGRLQVQAYFPETKNSLPKNIKFDTTPVTGKVPQVGVEFFNPDGLLPGVRFGTVVWVEPSKPTGVLTGRFGSNMAYQAKFRLFIDKTSYTLRGLSGTSDYFKIVDINDEGDGLVDVDGAEVTYEITDPDADYLDLTATFKPTKIAIVTLPQAELNIVKTIPRAISGKNFHPDRAAEAIGLDGSDVIETDYYTGKITWKEPDGTSAFAGAGGDNAKKFDSTKKYVAVITLKAKDNYTFARVPATDSSSDDVAPHLPKSAFFKLEGGKLVATETYDKYGNYFKIVNQGSENRSGQVQTDGVDDTMVVTVSYANTQTTINTGLKITHTNLVVSSLGLPTDVGDVTTPGAGTLNNVIYSDYVITKNIAWAGDPFIKGGADNGKFKPNWTWTGTYTIREVGVNTFKGIDNWELLFGNDDVRYIVREAQPDTVSSGGVITKYLMVGYSTKPKISVIGPASTEVVKDDTVTLTVTATVNTGASPSYEWYKASSATDAGTLIPSATGASYAVPAGDTATLGPLYYYCIVKATDVPSVKSSVAVVTVVNGIISTVAALTPANLNSFGEMMLTSGTGTLTVTAPTVTAGITLSYQWFWNPTESNEGGNSLGAASSTTPAALTHTIDATAVSDRWYFCEVTGGTGVTPKRSDPVHVIVAAEIINITPTVPTNQATAAGGGTVTLTVTLAAYGSGVAQGAAAGEAFEWYECDSAGENGIRIAGASLATYTTESITNSSTTTDILKYYYCVVKATGALEKKSRVATATFTRGT